MREGLDIESFGLLRLFSLDSSPLIEYFEKICVWLSQVINVNLPIIKNMNEKIEF